jgi:hypothetical protein
MGCSDNTLSRTIKTMTVTIPEGEALSGPIDMRGYVTLDVLMPAAFTGTILGFQHAITSNPATAAPLIESGAYITADPITVSTWEVAPYQLAGSHFIYLWSTDGLGADVVQAAARTFTIALKS